MAGGSAGSLAPSPDPAPPPEPTSSDLPPRWLALSLTVTLVVLLAACTVGVLAAMAGAFTPPVVWLGTFALAGPAVVLAVRAVPRWASPRSAHAAAAVVVAFAVAVSVYNGAQHGQHLVADRDPGVYVTTARHLMDEGDVLVPGPVGPFVDADGVSPNGAGFSPIRGDGTLEPQFPHLTAVTLALGGWGAETGLFLVTPVLAGSRPAVPLRLRQHAGGARWADGGGRRHGVTMPFTVFARDTYSEPITTVLVFGGLWLLHLAVRSPGPVPLWLLAGLTLGATNMARVDGYLYLAPITLALVLAVRIGVTSRSRRATRQRRLWCRMALLVTSAIGCGTRPR